MITLRDYQLEAVKKGIDILNTHKILILNYEVRTGKTHIALQIASNYKNVLFVTKKKAISSIEKDFFDAGHEFNMDIVNYESIHKYNNAYDLVICDESHTLGQYPKMSLRTKRLKEMVKNDLIIMTGTLLPESNSQIFHQLNISKFSPFKHINFYKWFHEFGTLKKKYVSYGEVNDYSTVNYDGIEPFIKPILLAYTQKEAGFVSKINEKVLTVKMSELTYKLIDKLKKDLVVEGQKETILADTGVKLMQKIHQLCSGTIKFDSGNRQVIDNSKISFIVNYFAGKKIAIFYKFIAELEAIKSMMDITQNIDEFNNSDKNIALQIVSGREGINLSKAECIVFYNIDFSAVSYWQARDRMTTIDRIESNVYWIFSENGIEQKIYGIVLNKKDYTLRTFKKDFNVKIPVKNN